MSFWFIALILSALVAAGSLITFLASREKGGAAITLGVSVLLALVSLLFSTMVTNGEGQSKVLVSWTGEAQGDPIEKSGLSWKKPWQGVENYDVRNQQVKFASTKGKQNKDANGPQITIQDREGVSANIDISVRYSIKSGSVIEIFRQYGSQEQFVQKFIENDIRAGLRSIPSNYNTIEVLNSRPKVEADIIEYLEKRWEGTGVQIETVSLQDIRYPKAVRERFADAQNARTEVEKAQAELDRNRIQAESNRVLSDSLTPEVLKQQQLEAMVEASKNGNLIIVPEDFSGIVNMPSK